MNQREKILAGGVAVVVVLAVGQYTLNSIRSSFDAKYMRLDSAQSRAMDQSNTITKGLLARRKISDATERSLPSNIEAAKTIYGEWLIRFAADSKLRNSSHNFLSESTVPGVYHSLKFSLNGDANLIELTQMLYRFYESPYLHRISDMKLEPTKEYGVMTVKLTIEILSIDSARKDQPIPELKDFKMMAHSADEYVKLIADRNLFAPANRPPKWSASATASTIQGTPLDFELAAKDPDEGQKVNYELLDSTAEGAQIRDGRLAWTPKEIGEYKVTVRATDTGIPRTSSTQEVVIKVVTAPPPVAPPTPEPKFDLATQTRVTALLNGRNGPEAWFTSRIEGKKISVQVGDDLDLAGISGKITAIGSNFVEVETDGRRWIIGQDESLADAFRRSQVD